MAKRKKLPRKDKDVDKNLDSYKLVNKQISRKLAAKRQETTKLRNLLTTCTSDIMKRRTECFKWKYKVLKLKDMQLDQSLSSSEKSKQMNRIFDQCITEMEEFLAIPTVSSYEYTKKRSHTRKENRNPIHMDTTDEENENDHSEKEVVAAVASDSSSKQEEIEMDGPKQKKRKIRAQNENENKKRAKALHTFFHNDKENGMSAEPHGCKSKKMCTTLVKHGDESEESKESKVSTSRLTSRPKRNVCPVEFLRY